jgi:hypothetical protein
MADLITLAKSSYWPLPQKALDWIAESPADRARRQKRMARRMGNIIRNVLATELPEAIAAVTEGAMS